MGGGRTDADGGDFTRAEFSGGQVSFTDAKFSADLVNSGGAVFSGGQVGSGGEVSNIGPLGFRRPGQLPRRRVLDTSADV